MARLPDDTFFGASHAGPLELPSATGGASVPTQPEQAAAYNEAKADSDYLTRIQELRAELDEEADPSRLSAYAMDFQAATAARAAAFSDPEQRQRWMHGSTLDAEGIVAAKAHDLNGRNEITATDERLKQIRDFALQGSGDEAARLIDSGNRLINGLLSAGYIDAATAQAKQRSWAEEYATEWLRRRRPEEQLAMLGDAPFSDNVIQGSGSAPTGLTRGTGTLVDFIPQDKRPDLLLAAKKEVARNAEIRATERFDLNGQILDEAVQGRTALPERRIIEEEPDLNPALKDVLLRKHDIAAENKRIFEIAQMNASNPDYVWNPRGEADKKALSVLDRWTAVVSGIASADPQTKSIALKRFASMGMVSDDVKGTLEGMIRSGNEQKIEFAMVTLDGMERLNPNGFKDSFEKETVKTLMAWQNRGDQTPVAFGDMLKRVSDPAQAKAREAWEAEGRKLASSVSDRTVLSVHADPNWPDAAKSLTDADGLGVAVHREAWGKLFAEGFASSDGNVAAAKQYADRMIQADWAVSSSGGGRLMKDAPETLPDGVLPMVDGSRDWMKYQVETAVRGYIGGTDVWNRVPAYGLVALPSTRTEIETLKAGGELPDGQLSPTWGLVYVDPATGAPAMVPFAFDVAPPRGNDGIEAADKKNPGGPNDGATVTSTQESELRTEASDTPESEGAVRDYAATMQTCAAAYRACQLSGASQSECLRAYLRCRDGARPVIFPPGNWGQG